MDNLIVLGLVAAVFYAAASVLWPFVKCRRCNGTGRRRSPTGKAWRPCGSCAGGKRVRLGRRIYEALRHE